VGYAFSANSGATDLDMHHLFNIENQEGLDSGDALSALSTVALLGGGAYLGSKLGNKYGEHVSKKTLDELNFNYKKNNES